MNPGVQTVESELESAISRTGAVHELNAGDLQKHGWNRASRTDKGVHAFGQVVSLKMSLGDDSDAQKNKFIEALSKELPRDIAVFDVLKVNKKFNSKISCTGRQYEYLIPTFLFEPHPDEWKKTADFFASDPTTSERSLLSGAHKSNLKLSPDSYPSSTIESYAEMRDPKYAVDEETRARFDRVLNKFVGTHKFHNYTKEIGYNDPSCNRFIVSFKSEPALTMDGMDLIRVTIEGQSFMLNQIRKMVSMALEVTRRGLDEDVIERSLMDEHMEIPMAPGEGLALKACLYGPPPSSYKGLKPEIEISFDKGACSERANAFRTNVVYPIIVAQEIESAVFSKWIAEMDRLVFPPPTTGEKKEYARVKRKRDDNKSQYLATRSQPRVMDKAEEPKSDIQTEPSS